MKNFQLFQNDRLDFSNLHLRPLAKDFGGHPDHGSKPRVCILLIFYVFKKSSHFDNLDFNKSPYLIECNYLPIIRIFIVNYFLFFLRGGGNLFSKNGKPI